MGDIFFKKNTRFLYHFIQFPSLFQLPYPLPTPPTSTIHSICIIYTPMKNIVILLIFRLILNRCPVVRYFVVEPVCLQTTDYASTGTPTVRFSWTRLTVQQPRFHSTVCHRSSNSFYIVPYYIKWVTTVWIDGM